MGFGFKIFWNGLRLKPNASDTTSEKGDLQSLDSDGKLYYNDGTGASALITADSTEVIKNKELEDSSVFFVDNADNTKKLAFQASGISSGTTRTLTAPDANTTIVGTLIAQTVSNKTLTSNTFDADLNTLSNVDNADIKAGAAIDRSKLASGSNNHVLINDGSGVMSSEATLAKSRGGSAQDNSAITFPASGVLTTNAGVQTLSNKTISITNNTIGSGAALAGDVLTADGASGSSFATPQSAPDSSYQLSNLGFSTSFAANALTINLTTKTGATPSGGSPVKIGFRDTAAFGDYFLQTCSSALDITIPSGATLGFEDGVTGYLYLYALDNSGTIELAVSRCLFDEGKNGYTTLVLQASSDLNSEIYSTNARAGVAIRLIGRMRILLAVAGTWDAGPTDMTVTPFEWQPVAYASATGTVGGVVDGVFYDIHWASPEVDTLQTVLSGSDETFTVPINGIYEVSVSANYNGGAASGDFCAARIKVNGGIILTRYAHASSNNEIYAQAFYMATLTAGDTIVTQAMQNGLTAPGFTANLSIKRIGL